MGVFGSSKDDLRLAANLLDGSRRARRTFRGRFHDEAEIALEHAPRAVELGLRLGDYLDGVAVSAARSLLDGVPASAEDERLDPHVQRVLGHRDFALALLLRRGVKAAWQEFESLFGDYLRSTFVRTGHRPEVAASRVDEVVSLLRGEPGQWRAAIDDYMGRSDLRVWLFVFVRTQIEGRWRREFAPPDLAVPPFTDDGSDLSLTVAAARDVFGDLEPEDRRVLDDMARGAGPAGVAAMLAEERIRPPTPAALARRHRDVVRTAHGKIVDRFHRLQGGERAGAEQRVLDVVLEDAARRLGPVYGVESRR